MELLFRSLKSEWLPATGYISPLEAKRDISYYLMDYYNWRCPHQHNDGMPPAKVLLGVLLGRDERVRLVYGLLVGVFYMGEPFRLE